MLVTVIVGNITPKITLTKSPTRMEILKATLHVTQETKRELLKLELQILLVREQNFMSSEFRFFEIPSTNQRTNHHK